MLIMSKKSVGNLVRYRTGCPPRHNSTRHRIKTVYIIKKRLPSIFKIRRFLDIWVAGPVGLGIGMNEPLGQPSFDIAFSTLAISGRVLEGDFCHPIDSDGV